MESTAQWAAKFADAAFVAGIATFAALALHLVLFALFARVARLSQGMADDEIVAALRQPARWSMVAVAISVAAETSPSLAHIWQNLARFVVPALLGWTAFALIRALSSAIEARAELSSDELVARSRKTRVAILSRTAAFVTVVITVALMLMGIPGVRQIGLTLIASAGLAAVAVGAAAQPALKSLIAGLQMAITELVRIGDLVTIDKQTGRIEDIRMSYVVIRTADESRIVVPTARFLDSTFQNWTRVSGGLTGSVTIPVRHGHALGPIRDAYLAALKSASAWDGRKGALHVADAQVGSVELRLVMSAATPAELESLRLSMREGMLEWLRENLPDSLCNAA